MKIATIIGARPQFIKAAPVSRKLRVHHREVIVHTGQHYDRAMSQVFFDELAIPSPDVNLGVGSGPHGAQTAAMLQGIEEVLLQERPDRVLVYGDTNSTIAGALAASKLAIPLVHVEAGLRSFNRRMPEELNRVVTDHLASLLLCPSEAAVRNLAREGVDAGVHLVGDVMADALAWAVNQVDAKGPGILERRGLERGRYLLCTLHRADITQDAERLGRVFLAMGQLDEVVIFPAHPRTKNVVTTEAIDLPRNIRMTEPLGYMEMVAIARGARMILTDSGGLQKEAYWLGVPCVTLRDETEWVETVENGWNMLVGATGDRIVAAVKSFSPPSTRPALYGNGHAAEHCVRLIADE